MIKLINEHRLICAFQAALLHDTVEDTDTTYEELVTEFGKDVAGEWFENLLKRSLLI